MKPKSQFVVIRQSGDRPNYYIGRLRIFELDGEVDDVVILHCLGMQEGVRTFTCTLVEEANLRNMSEPELARKCAEYITGVHKASASAQVQRAIRKPGRADQDDKETRQTIIGEIYEDRTPSKPTQPTTLSEDIQRSIDNEVRGSTLP